VSGAAEILGWLTLFALLNLAWIGVLSVLIGLVDSPGEFHRRRPRSVKVALLVVAGPVAWGVWLYERHEEQTALRRSRERHGRDAESTTPASVREGGEERGD
jgi:hypothetical protein